MGKHLRSRYIKLLPADGYYSKENMRVQSSHLERCLMSAQSLLAGLVQTGSTNLLPIPWQPVAVNMIPVDKDYVRNFEIKCSEKLYNNHFTLFRRSTNSACHAQSTMQCMKNYSMIQIHKRICIDSMRKIRIYIDMWRKIRAR